MKFIDEPGPDGEPTLWALEGGDTDQYQYTGILARHQLTPDAQRFWPDIVARMTGTVITNDDATVALIADQIRYYTRAKGATPVNTARNILDALTGVPHA